MVGGNRATLEAEVGVNAGAGLVAGGEVFMMELSTWGAGMA